MDGLLRSGAASPETLNPSCDSCLGDLEASKVLGGEESQGTEMYVFTVCTVCVLNQRVATVRREDAGCDRLCNGLLLCTILWHRLVCCLGS